MLTNTTLVYFLEKESYLLSVSQKSNKLKKKNKHYSAKKPERQSKNQKKKKNWNEFPEVTKFNLLLKAEPASRTGQVAQSFVRLRFEEFPRPKASKPFWAHVPVLFHSCHEKLFCSHTAATSLVTVW